MTGTTTPVRACRNRFRATVKSRSTWRIISSRSSATRKPHEPHPRRYRFGCGSWGFLVAELLDDIIRQVLLDFTVARNRLRHARTGVVVPVMFAATANQHAA